MLLLAEEEVETILSWMVFGLTGQTPGRLFVCLCWVGLGTHAIRLNLSSKKTRTNR